MRPLPRAATLALTAVLAAATLTGCGAIADRVGEAAAEKALEGAMGADIDVDEGEEEVTITSDDGSMTMGTKLPAEWPSSVPLPADHVVGSAIVIDEGSGPVTSAILQVPGATFEDVQAEMEAALAGSEWTAEGEPIASEMAEIRMWAQTFTNGELDLYVSVGSIEEEVNVQYQVGPASED